MLAWYRRAKRDLPWRRTRDPYAIWISEAMLQQTRVETVIPYYERFLARFPSVQSLADAPVDGVLGEWSGLGYYSRARNLHRAAQDIVERFGGRLPDALDSLQSLPGIGRYTAGAIASIAFDRPAPIVDGNVARVLARLWALPGGVADPETRDALWTEAERLVRGAHPGDFNQALMELGAQVCTPRAPRCSACPVASDCRGHATGAPTRYPQRAARSAPRRLRAFAALITRRDRALAVRRPDEGLLGGLWELPGEEFQAARQRAAARLAHARLEERTGLRLEPLQRGGTVEVVFTHRHFALTVYLTRVVGGRLRPGAFPEHRWVAPWRLSSLPMATATRRALDVALENWRG